ncbi:MAG: SRPBCC family protein [Cyanobacteria bacterium CRU_2_1]|nr:SRPBCC family protein [Cyanobacteria bacterium CRU_2_1]
MNQSIKVEKTVTIDKPTAELYRFWRHFENLPRFTRHLKDVRVSNDKRSHWITSGLLDGTIEWDAEIIDDRPNELIAWKSVANADVDNAGSVQFKPAPGDRGTEVKVVTVYNPPAGVIGDAISKLFGENPKQQIGDDLARFKMLMEAGEIATNDGQPSGRRNSKD